MQNKTVLGHAELLIYFFLTHTQGKYDRLLQEEFILLAMDAFSIESSCFFFLFKTRNKQPRTNIAANQSKPSVTNENA